MKRNVGERKMLKYLHAQRRVYETDETVNLDDAYDKKNSMF